MFFIYHYGRRYPEDLQITEQSWGDIMRRYLTPAVIIMFFTGDNKGIAQEKSVLWNQKAPKATSPPGVMICQHFQDDHWNWKSMLRSSLPWMTRQWSVLVSQARLLFMWITLYTAYICGIQFFPRDADHSIFHIKFWCTEKGGNAVITCSSSRIRSRWSLIMLNWLPLPRHFCLLSKASNRR